MSFIDPFEIVLTEGSVYERLRRGTVATDPQIAQASLLYSDEGRDLLARTHREYMQAAFRRGLPILVQTDTWRCNRDRVEASPYRDRAVNEEHAAFLCGMRDEFRAAGAAIFAGGLLGPKGDAYDASTALSRADAARFHAWQIERLAGTGLDFLIAATLPALSEAAGIADAISGTNKPYVLSFVIRRDGTLLDGTLLSRAIRQIDASVMRPPAFYMVNCVHPRVFASALAHQEDDVSGRLIGLQANTSARDPEELDGSPELETMAPDLFATEMLRLKGLRVVGGCCGTDLNHIEHLARRAG